MSGEEVPDESDCAAGEYASKLLQHNFVEAIDDFNWMKIERQNNLSNLNDLIKRLIKKGCTTVAT